MHSGPAERPAPPATDISFSELLKIAKRRMPVALTVGIVIATATFILSMRQQPTYAAEALVMIDREQAPVVESPLADGRLSDSAMVDTEVEILRSRRLAGRVAEQLDLFSRPEFQAVTPTGLSAIIQQASDLVTGVFWQTPDSSVWLSAEQAADQVKNQTIDKLIRATTVRRSGLTYVISIEVVTTDPVLAADIANAYVDQYLVNQVESKFESSQVMDSWLNTRVSQLQTEVQAAERSVDEFRRSAGLLNVTGSDLVERQILELSADIAVQQRKLEEGESKLEVANRSKQTDTLSPVIASDTIIRLRTAQAQLEEERGRVSSTSGPMHPAYIEIEKRAAALEREIKAETDRIVASLESDVGTARRSLAVSRGRLAELSGRATRNNSAMVRLVELERQAGAARTIYEEFLARKQELSVIAELEQPTAQRVSSAVVATDPVAPNARLQLAIALLAGAASGVLTIMLREALENRYLSPTDVERRTGLTCLTIVPAVAEAPHEYVAKRPFSFLSECMRRVLSDFDTGDSPSRDEGRVVSFVSSGASDGKTATLLALSLVAQQAGRKRILVVDADLRKTTLSTLLDMADNDGLRQYLSGELALDRVIHTHAGYGIDVLPCSFDPAYAAFFSKNAVDQLFKEVRSKYDLILIDTAAFFAISETRYFVRMADDVVAVIRWKSSLHEHVQDMLTTLKRLDKWPRFALLTRYKGSQDSYLDRSYYYDRDGSSNMRKRFSLDRLVPSGDKS